MRNKHIGSSFDDFLKKEGIHEAATTHAIKRVIAWQLAEAMKAKKISKAEMARRRKPVAHRSRAFSIPRTTACSSTPIQKAAAIVGKRLTIILEERIFLARQPDLPCRVPVTGRAGRTTSFRVYAYFQRQSFRFRSAQESAVR